MLPWAQAVLIVCAVVLTAALVTAILALRRALRRTDAVLAIASLGGSNAMKQLLLAQQQSSDQWAFYQARVIREHLYRTQKLTVELALAEPSALRGAERVKYEALAKRFADEEKRYNTEKKDVELEARKLEALRDHHRARDPYFEFGEVLLQIAIVSASVSILSTSRAMFFFSLILAVGGALLTANGFLLFFHVPFLHH